MIRRPRLAFAAVAALSVGAVAAPAHAATAHPTRPVDTGVASMAPTVLTGDVIYRVGQQLTDHAHVATPGTTTLTLGVSVADRDPAGLKAYGDAANTPGTAVYRDFLTPDELDARFGATPATIDAVAGWLASGGITVVRHPETPEYLTATGTTAQIGALMHTSFVTFTDSALRGVVANTTAPTVPAAVLGVAGLNTGTHPHVPQHKPVSHYDEPPTGLLSPQDLWDIYDQPAVDKGEGQGLALFGEGTAYDSSSKASPQPSVESDLRLFEKEYGFPAIPYTLTYFRADPSEAVADDGGYDEWTLDAQAAQGMAPNASELVDYFGATASDPDVIGSYAQWADDPTGPLQGSTSYGPCEDVPDSATLQTIPGVTSFTYIGNPNQDMYAAVYQRAEAMGKTLFSASGDTSGCPLTAASVNGVTLTPTQIQFYPGDDPNVVGVGGSVLYFDGATDTTKADRITEYPWSYSGGGPDAFIAAPSYQATAVQPVTTTGTTPVAATPIDTYQTPVDHHGNPYANGPQPARLQPDVAALSGDGTGNGFGIVSDGTPDQFGAGTSLSSPLWLGMWARVQAAAPANSQGKYVGVGFANPVFYRSAVGQSTYLSNWYDTGNAMEDPASVPVTNATTSSSPAEGGFDTATGWGVPDVAKLITFATGSTSFVPTNPGTPAGTLPDSPLALGLPLVAVVAVAAAVGVRRRRRA